MRKKVRAGQQKVAVCLVEHNPLAARQLKNTLERDSKIRTFSLDDILKNQSNVNTNISIFVLDKGTIPSPLSKILFFLRSRFKDAKIIIIDKQISDSELCKLLPLGIEGYLPYEKVENELKSAIHSVSQNHLYVPSQVLEQYVRNSAQLFQSNGRKKEGLTPREKSVLELIQKRLSNKEISFDLKISKSTVKFHLSNIFAKMGVNDRYSVLEVTSSQLTGPWFFDPTEM